MFWSILIELCNKKNMKPNQVGKQLGISSASFTKWKNGSTPTVDALIKLSEYFNVSIDYLVYGQSPATLEAQSAPKNDGFLSLTKMKNSLSRITVLCIMQGRYKFYLLSSQKQRKQKSYQSKISL